MWFWGFLKGECLFTRKLDDLLLAKSKFREGFERSKLKFLRLLLLLLLRNLVVKNSFKVLINLALRGLFLYTLLPRRGCRFVFLPDKRLLHALRQVLLQIHFF